MTEDVRLVLTCALALSATALATPAAIAVARRTAFYDHPTGYKQHTAATPYLGGAAVVLGLVAASLAFGVSFGWGDLDIALAVAVALLVIGTLDDRVGLGIGVRLAVEIAIGVALYAVGLGWGVFGNDVANLLLTVAFVLAVVNAYNLMDNLDGAAPTVATVAAGAIGVYSAVEGDLVAAALGLGLAGACAGFLPYNLASPGARIFLGDGGSMAIGGTLAALMMSLPGTGGLGWELIAVSVVLVGVPAFDTTLVVYSRLRRGAHVLSGGRDHLTHRLLDQLGTARRVAFALAAAQGTCSGLAIALLQLDAGGVALGAMTALVLGIALIVALEPPRRLSAELSAPRGVQPVQDESPA
jgi:UDP-GlcNAc:undecaprenyl-phosphate GlcNAc-1-phosphate transferase